MKARLSINPQTIQELSCHYATTQPISGLIDYSRATPRKREPGNMLEYQEWIPGLRLASHGMTNYSVVRNIGDRSLKTVARIWSPPVLQDIVFTMAGTGLLPYIRPVCEVLR